MAERHPMLNRRRLLSLLPMSLFGFKLPAKAAAPTRYDTIILAGFKTDGVIDPKWDRTQSSCNFRDAEFFMLIGQVRGERTTENLARWDTAKEAERESRKIYAEKYVGIPFEVWRCPDAFIGYDKRQEIIEEYEKRKRQPREIEFGVYLRKGGTPRRRSNG